MIKIGITGSIGMGKTTVSNMFRFLKIPVFDSDQQVRDLLDNDYDIIEKISEIWPDTVFLHKKQRTINKTILGDKIFKSEGDRKQLERLIHPIVKNKRDNFIQNSKSFSLVGLDIPLLYETGTNKDCDYVFLVNTSKKNQKNRVLKRPNMTEKKFELIGILVKNIIAAKMSNRYLFCKNNFIYLSFVSHLHQ